MRLMDMLCSLYVQVMRGLAAPRPPLEQVPSAAPNTMRPGVERVKGIVAVPPQAGHQENERQDDKVF